jgi:hypothetical protein
MGGMGEEGISNLYIDKVAARCCGRRHFQGVFSCDTIPAARLRRKKRFSFVCNLSKVGEVGTHFITVVADAKSVIYIDSYGLPCFNEDIAAFLRGCGRTVWYNSTTIQHPTLSRHCGYYALLFVLFFAGNGSSSSKKTLQLSFSDHDLLSNDAKCTRYLSQLIKKNNNNNN